MYVDDDGPRSELFLRRAATCAEFSLHGKPRQKPSDHRSFACHHGFARAIAAAGQDFDISSRFYMRDSPHPISIYIMPIDFSHFGKMSAFCLLIQWFCYSAFSRHVPATPPLHGNSQRRATFHDAGWLSLLKAISLMTPMRRPAAHRRFPQRHDISSTIEYSDAAPVLRCRTRSRLRFPRRHFSFYSQHT